MIMTALQASSYYLGLVLPTSRSGLFHIGASRLSESRASATDLGLSR